MKIILFIMTLYIFSSELASHKEFSISLKETIDKELVKKSRNKCRIIVGLITILIGIWYWLAISIVQVYAFQIILALKIIMEAITIGTVLNYLDGKVGKIVNSKNYVFVSHCFNILVGFYVLVYLMINW